MKKLLLIILSLSLITSCEKDGLITDRKTVTYQVSCESCSVSYRDNADKAQSQHVVEHWEITFSAARMLEASMEISRTAEFANVQPRGRRNKDKWAINHQGYRNHLS